jgi:hypothetical protein
MIKKERWLLPDWSHLHQILSSDDKLGEKKINFLAGNEDFLLLL